MFVVNNDFLNEEVGGVSTHINKSGCYEVVITDAVIKTYQNSRAESLNLSVETMEGQKAWINLFYKKKDGTDVPFNLRHITHLTFLSSVNPTADKDGKIKAFVDKVVGIFLEVKTTELKDGGTGYDYNLIGFYNPSTKQTAKEMTDKLPAEVYGKYVEKFKDAQEVILSKQPKQTSMEGFYVVNDNDIPF